MVFGPDERRTIADMRRSGAVEARRGGASDEAIGNKLGNAFATNKMINETYGATDLAKSAKSTRRGVDGDQFRNKSWTRPTFPPVRVILAKRNR